MSLCCEATLLEDDRFQYTVFDTWLLISLVYAPASEFMAYYYCGERPDVGEVNDIFGTGVYLAWALMAAGSFLQYRAGCKGVFWPQSKYQGLSQTFDEDFSGLHETSRPVRRYPISELLAGFVDCLGVEGLTFFFTTIGFMVYYTVKVREDISGPSIEAPARVICVACILTAFLTLGSLDMTGTHWKYRRRIWRGLHFACVALITWGSYWRTHGPWGLL